MFSGKCSENFTNNFFTNYLRVIAAVHMPQTLPITFSECLKIMGISSCSNEIPQNVFVDIRDASHPTNVSAQYAFFFSYMKHDMWIMKSMQTKRSKDRSADSFLKQ